MALPSFLDSEGLFSITGIFLFLSFLILFLRSFELTIIKGGYYYQQSENNRLRQINLPSPRGRILSRDGQVLLDNLIVYTDFEGNQLDRENGLLKKARGEEVVDVLKRRYYLAQSGAHLTGYLGAVTEEELNQIRCPQKEINFQLHDQVGRGGLEEEYDCLLTGKEGKRLVEVNSREKIVRELGRVEAQPGRDLIISLDLDLQKFCWQKLKDQKGAIVVLEADTGQVLALVSSPSFNPNHFTWQRDEAKIESYLTDTGNTPFLNRSLGGAYPPGSVFKPVVALGALAEGKITPETIIEDNGPIIIGQWQYTNWYWNQYGRTEGEVNLVKGLKRSNDIYFYKIGEWLGANNIIKWAEKFGLGEPTGIDLPAEAGGLVPSPEWKKKTKGEPWFLGNTYHLAIGQGDLTATPLQIAMMTAAVANGGKLCRPHLAAPNIPKVSNCRDLGINQKHLKVVQEGMFEACRPGGTGFPFFNFTPLVGCKTGTAELGNGTDDAHAWFTLFVPVLSTAPDTPKVVRQLADSGVASRSVVITVFIERGGSGAYVAAPIAREIAEYLKEQKYF